MPNEASLAEQIAKLAPFLDPDCPANDSRTGFDAARRARILAKARRRLLVAPQASLRRGCRSSQTAIKVGRFLERDGRLPSAGPALSTPPRSDELAKDLARDIEREAPTPPSPSVEISSARHFSDSVAGILKSRRTG